VINKPGVIEELFWARPYNFYYRLLRRTLVRSEYKWAVNSEQRTVYIAIVALIFARVDAESIKFGIESVGFAA